MTASGQGPQIGERANSELSGSLGRVETMPGEGRVQRHGTLALALLGALGLLRRVSAAEGQIDARRTRALCGAQPSAGTSSGSH